jgi:hypothetical protein
MKNVLPRTRSATSEMPAARRLAHGGRPERGLAVHRTPHLSMSKVPCPRGVFHRRGWRAHSGSSGEQSESVGRQPLGAGGDLRRLRALRAGADPHYTQPTTGKPTQEASAYAASLAPAHQTKMDNPKARSVPARSAQKSRSFRLRRSNARPCPWQQPSNTRGNLAPVIRDSPRYFDFIHRKNVVAPPYLCQAAGFTPAFGQGTARKGGTLRGRTRYSL